MPGRIVIAFSAIAIATAAPAASASDGQAGPLVFDGAALDTAMEGLNAFIQKRQAAESQLADLRSASPAKDFATIARASGDAPGNAEEMPDHGFGPAIAGGQSLDLHLAAFTVDRIARDEPIFVRVARDASRTTFESAAGLARPIPLGEFGSRVRDDVSLNRELATLTGRMREQSLREEALRAALPPGHDGASFDRYAATLLLY